MLIDWLKIKYKYLKGLKKAYFQRENIVFQKNKQAYIMLAANYNNLGDIAITKAQEEFLKKNLPNDYEIIIIPHDETYKKYLAIKKNLNKDTIITLIGGGNSGTLYEFIEEPRRFILKFFKECKIISFPQSVVYNSDNKIYKEEFISLCTKCKNLTLVAREKKSYKVYKNLLKDKINILLVPDIVFTLDVENKICKRKGINYIFRNDMEKNISEKKEKKVIDISKKYYSDYSFNDTCNVNITGNGYEELDEFISIILKKELVITDRLHGMILSYVTDTPCIALDNNNQKISSTYETWLSSQSLVTMDDEIYKIEKFLENKKKGEKRDLKEEYIPLINSLLK